MGDITHADLQAMTGQITAAIQREVGLARDEFAKDIRGVYHRIDDLKRKQDEQNGRVNGAVADIAALRTEQSAQCDRVEKCEEAVDEYGKSISVLDERTKNVTPALGFSLTKKQKGALIAGAIALTGSAADILRHVLSFVLAYFQHRGQP